MTEKDKEINELRRENDRLNKTNTVLLNALVEIINEYNAMLKTLSEHSTRIKQAVNRLNRPNNARNS